LKDGIEVDVQGAALDSANQLEAITAQFEERQPKFKDMQSN
jgi:hypothetical protein